MPERDMTVGATLTKEAKKASDKKDYNSPAVDKAVDVIEFLASRREAASITTISTGIGRSVGEIYRVIRVLEQRKLVYKNPADDRYQISLRLYDLTFRFPPIERLVQFAKVEMDILAEDTRQSCHLVVAEGQRVTIVATKESPLPMHYSVRVGSSFPLFETSSGVVLAAFASADQKDLLLQDKSADQTEELRARFATVLSNGFERRQSDTVEGLINLSVPVRSQEGTILAALTVPYLRQKKATLDQDEVLSRLIETGTKIGQNLG